MNNKLISLAAKHQILLVVAVVFLLSGLFIGRLRSLGLCTGHAVADEHGCTDEHDACGSHDAHEHETAHAGCGDGCLDELDSILCEHDMAAVDCDDCRFEVGVVKLDPAIAAALIETGEVQTVQRHQTLTFTGQIQLDRTRTVEVVSPGGGQVLHVAALLGESVEQGDVLAVIHSADLGQAKAAFLEVQANLELAETTFNREKGLYEKQVSSQADYLSALSAFKTAEAAYAAAEKRLSLFGLNSEQIATVRDEKQNGRFAELVLRAPQAGTIIAQNVTAGMIVDTVESLYTIADLSNLWVWCDVYAKDLAVLHEHFSKDRPLRASVRVSAFGNAPFDGVVDLVGHIMDERTRTVKMRVQVKNPDSKLRPGLFADIAVDIPLDGHVTVVPNTAVMSDAGRHFVFQHWKDDLWARTNIVTGPRWGDYTEIQEGLPAGTAVVTSGAFMLKSDILREKMGAGCAH